MIESILQSLAWPFLLSGAAALGVEQTLRPRPSLRSRPLRSHLIHLGIWSIAYALALATTQRPWFAGLLVVALLLVLVQVSNAKLRSLREPFVFADVEFFVDSLRHPRLFLPYLGLWRAVLGGAVFGGVLYVGFVVEPSLTAHGGGHAFAASVALLLLLGVLSLGVGSVYRADIRYDAEVDLRRHGLSAALWHYARAEWTRTDEVVTTPYARRVVSTPPRLPHIVVVQSESYFDARRLHDGIRSDVYNHFDAARHASLQHGLLRVPAWGGNTTRSEFAFLSGLSEAELGVHRFNPHRRFARRSLPSLASLLRDIGYGTVCLHPYPVRFNARNVVFPALGFEEFIDIRAFGTEDRFGPYVGDRAVAAMACELLESARKPMLLFLITMENHGPLHLERPRPEDAARFFTIPPTLGFDTLTVYLRHVMNADAMIARLQNCLASLPGEGILCWYGDHVPIMPRVYDRRRFDDGRTDYFVWRPGGPRGATVQQELSLETLGTTLLGHAGIEVDSAAEFMVATGEMAYGTK